jgi:psiF repeat
MWECDMRFLSPVLAAVLLLSLAAAVQAQQPTNSQQDRMKSCNSQASSSNLTGSARSTFMSNCLSGSSTSGSGSSTQQEKMKSCNSQATTQGLAGDARKSFLSSCLKNP